MYFVVCQPLFNFGALLVLHVAKEVHVSAKREVVGLQVNLCRIDILAKLSQIGNLC